jgi:DNA-binding CsgD family transcriptional regulator
MLALSLLNYEKLQAKAFRDVSVIASASILFTLVEGTRSVFRLTRGVLGSPPLVYTVCLTVAACGLLAYAVPTLAFRLVKTSKTNVHKVIHATFIGAMICAGWLGVLPGGPPFNALQLGVSAALLSYGAVVTIVYFPRLSDPVLRKGMLTISVQLASMLVLFVFKPLILSRLPISPEMREEPWVMLLFQISIGSFLIFYAVKYFYKPVASAAGFSLPPEFVNRYGISNRECEIIALVVQGFSHKEIGEKLFISSRTVKNHIYNIYQKTGAENKVQLLNLVQATNLF